MAASGKQDDWMSVGEAAREIGKAYHTVKTLALHGELESDLVAGRTVISRKSVKQYRTRHGLEQSEAAAR